MKKSSKLDIFVTNLLLETKTQKHNYMINNTLDANFQIYTYIYTYFRDFSRAGQQESARAIRSDNSVRQNASKTCFCARLARSLALP